MKQPRKMRDDFDYTIEGQLTSGVVRDTLGRYFNEFDDETKEQLYENPKTSIDYIGRYTLWAQAMKGRAEDMQFSIMHQLVLCYAQTALWYDAIGEAGTA